MEAIVINWPSDTPDFFAWSQTKPVCGIGNYRLPVDPADLPTYLLHVA